MPNNQENLNRRHGQQLRRIRENAADTQDTLGMVADNQRVIAGVLIGHEARHDQHDQRHDQAERDMKMMKARLAAAEAELRRARQP